MLLSTTESERFFKLHRSFMWYVNEQQKIISDIKSPDEFSALPPESRVEVRDAAVNAPDLIKQFAELNPFGFHDDEISIVLSWQHQVAGRFYVFRNLKNYTVFLNATDPPVAYGVLALTQSFEELFGPNLPVYVQTVLLPYGDKIIYDGLLSGFNISFGGGIKRGLNESYKAAKERHGVVTSLPPTERSAPKAKPTKKAVRKEPDKSQQAMELIVGMTDQFCQQHLNEEYASLCRKLTQKLARKRPSPLISGRPTTWAAGIVRTIGMVNFLDDNTTKPFMKLTAIDKAFGVGESTGQGKSKEIRRMLKIHQFDHHWMLPSRMDDNSIMWMLEVNGFITDIRTCPRDAQQVAFEKGLIPYIPADR